MSPTPSEAVIDRYLREQRRKLEALERDIQLMMREAYEDALRAIELEIDAAIRAGNQWDATRLRYLEDRIDAQLADWERGAMTYRDTVIQRRAADLSHRDFAEFWRLFDQGLPPVLDAIPGLSGGSLLAGGHVPRFGAVAFERSIIRFGEGSPLQQSLGKYTSELRDLITSEVRNGMATQANPRTVIRAIMDRATGEYNEARLEALVRTEMMQAYRAQHAADAEAVGDQIVGYVWSAAKSRRTCLACLGMDNTFFDKKEYPNPPERWHVNCRCRVLPVPREGGMEWLASRQGGEAWLQSQDDATLARMMPNEEAREAFRAGTLRLNDFVGEARHPVWGDSVYQLSGRRALVNMDRAGKSPVNPRVRKDKNGVWGGDDLPVMEWEAPEARVVLSPDIQGEADIPSNALRWKASKLESVKRNHTEAGPYLDRIPELMQQAQYRRWDTRPGKEDGYVFVWSDGETRLKMVIGWEKDLESWNMVTIYGPRSQRDIRRWQKEFGIP